MTISLMAQPLLTLSLTLLVLMPAVLGAHEEEASRTKSHLVRQALSRGGKHLRESQLEQAIDQFKTAVAADPQSAEAHMLLGYAYRVQGRYELLGEAKAELRQALALDPTLIWARFYLAKIYVDFERLQDANTSWIPLSNQIPTSPKFSHYLGK